MEHALGAGIDAVDGSAGGDVEIVDEADRVLADVAEGGRVLEPDGAAVGHGQRRRGFRQGAVAEAAPAPGVHDDMVGRPHLGGRHAPLRRRRLLQHGARGRARPAHRHEPMTQAARAVGVLVAEAFLVAPRLRDADPRPIGLELVGHHHGDRGAHALPHLGTVAGHGDGAVLADRDEDGGIVAPAVRHAVCAELLLLGRHCRRQADGEDEHAGAGEEGAAADIGEAARRVEDMLGHRRAPLAQDGFDRLVRLWPPA